MDFIIIFSGYIIPATSYGSKLCFIINLYFILHLYIICMPFYSNDGTARVTYFSSNLISRLDILTTDYFFTSFYLIMLLQNNSLIPIREFFAQSTPGMKEVHLVLHNLNSLTSNYRLFRRLPSTPKITPLTQC